MSNKLNPFEEQLKKAAHGHEVPYDANQWDQLSKKLDTTTPSSISFTKWGVAAVALLAIGVVIYTIVPSQKESITPIETSVTELPKPIINIESTPDEYITTETINKNQDQPTSGTEEVYTPKDQSQNHADKLRALESADRDAEIKVEPQSDSKTDATIPTEKLRKKILNEPLPNVILENTTVCAGVEIHAKPSIKTGENLFWNLGNGEIVEAKELTYTYYNAGEFEISVAYQNKGEFSETTTLVVNPKPDASFTIKENIERGAIPVVYLASETGGEKAYTWSLGDGYSVNGEGVSHTYRKKGDYEVSLRVVNKYGCFWTNFKPIHIAKDFNLLAPQAFSPNSDGLNDVWFPEALKTGYYNFELHIYDQSGNLVFETTSPEASFDGRVRGNITPTGVGFMWRASVVDPHGVRQEFSGTFVTLY